VPSSTRQINGQKSTAKNRLTLLEKLPFDRSLNRSPIVIQLSKSDRWKRFFMRIRFLAVLFSTCIATSIAAPTSNTLMGSINTTADYGMSKPVAI